MNGMKKSNQIVGLPIISISDGQEIGSVKSLVINPDKGSIDFLTIEHEDWQVSVKAIPFKKVVGIGEYAVTVESESAIIDLNEIPIANQLVNKKIKINGTRVMTRKGMLIGEVGEYYVDEDNGFILGMSLNLSDREVALASNSVLTYGKDIIIVRENAESYFLDSVEQLKDLSKKQQTDAELLENPASSMNEPNSGTLEVKGEDPLEGIQEKTAPINGEVQAIKDKQIEILRGKKVIKDIYDKDGNLLLARGVILGKEEIMKAQDAGPSVVVELSMHVDGE